MISHRLLSSEMCGLKGRVTACRKRLRVNRVAQQAHVNNDVEMLGAEINLVDSEPRNYAADYSVPTAVVFRAHSSPFAEAIGGESETLVLAGEQEVGIR